MGLYLLRPAPRPVATDLPYRSVSRRSSRGRLAKLEFTRQHDACGNTVPSGGTDAAFTQILLADLLGRGLRQRGDEFDVARHHERGQLLIAPGDQRSRFDALTFTQHDEGHDLVLAGILLRTYPSDRSEEHTSELTSLI